MHNFVQKMRRVRAKITAAALPLRREALLCLARAFSSAAPQTTRVLVCGSGPGGFYTAKYLLKDAPDVCVDVIDALPTPFGA